jgi:uncharacterized membrane protein (DUF4010 family)
VGGSTLEEAGGLIDSAIGPGAFLPGLALALAVGILIGIERGWQRREEREGGRVAGVRTFSLMGLFGGLVGLGLGGTLHAAAMILVAGAAAVIAVGYYVDARQDGNVSATSALASIITIALGALASSGQMALAAVGAGATVILLASREPLHRALVETSEADIKALVRLVLVVFVVLPLLPDTPLGPYGLNPRRLWTVVVITGAISFIGYVLVRLLGGRKGVMVTALVGALVSSTAVTLESARRIRAGENIRANEAAIAVASTIMIARACVLVIALAPHILELFLALVLPALAVSAVFSAVLLYRSIAPGVALEPAALKPPDLKLALLFGALVALMATAASWAEQQAQGSGAAVVALGGLFDVDSAIAALGTLPPGTLTLQLAAYAVATPVVFNTLFKAGLALGIGGPKRTRVPVAALVATAAAVAVSMILLY